MATWVPEPGTVWRHRETTDPKRVWRITDNLTLDPLFMDMEPWEDWHEALCECLVPAVNISWQLIYIDEELLR